MRTVYEAAGGSEELVGLARAWHSRVMADEVVSHAFSHGFHPEHSERLAAYWAQALGGPATYSATYGDETTVVRMHSGNGPHEEMDRRAIACFDQALEDIGLAADDQVRRVLHVNGHPIRARAIIENGSTAVGGQSAREAALDATAPAVSRDLVRVFASRSR